MIASALHLTQTQHGVDKGSYRLDYYIYRGGISDDKCGKKVSKQPNRSVLSDL